MKYRLFTFLWISASLLFVGCERLDYTTWTCQAQHANDKPMRMKLDGAELELMGEKLRFCGSLGQTSYFDHQCPQSVETSKASFMTKTGEFKFQQMHYFCKVL